MISQDWNYLTPEQKQLWKLCNGLLAWNTITPLFYQGAAAGSEFLTYAATKLYIALDFIASYASSSAQAAGGSIIFYDMANAVNFYGNNQAIVWNTTGAALNYYYNNIMLKNIYFSRTAFTNYTHLRFNGYRLTII